MSVATEQVLWVYGVVAGAVGDAPAVGGVDDHPVRLHRHAGLAALVSEVPRDRFDEAALKTRLEDLGSVERLARAHDAVLDAAAGTVVPFRLCTIYSSGAGLDHMLDRETARLEAALARLDRMQELGVKVYLRTSKPVPGPAPDSGTAYLARKRERRDAAEQDREAGDAAVAAIHAMLAERAAAAMLSQPHDRRLSGRDDEMVLNAAYLVPSEGADAFRTLVDQLARDHHARGLQLELTGPWPPYHFVDPPES